MINPTVSVCILTYQHARFIAQAVEGALMQKTEFPVEILIGEDESTDGTRAICLDYAQRHPARVRVFLRYRRDVVLIDGRPRGSFNFRMTLREAKGEFIALCEGDDYWTDPEKLQMQVDYLRANPDCVGCFHDAKLVDANGRTLLKSYFQSDQDKFTQRDVLESLFSREPTCSLVFRKTAFAEPLPEWYLRRPSDLYLDILLTNHGSLGFVRRNMGAYRQHAGGIWSGQREALQLIELIIRLKLLLVDAFFIEKYKDLLLLKIDEFQSALFTRKDTAGEIERLEKVVQEQTQAVKSMRTECDRLTAVAKDMQAEAKRAAKDGQKHIDELLAQVKKLSATSHQQTKHIAVLEKERDRLTAEAKAAAAEANRAAKDGQKHIDRLLAQLKELAATSEKQNAYIATLEKDRDRLTALMATQSKLAATSRQQAKYIAVLEKDRERLDRETKAAAAEANRAAKDGQKHIDDLLAQLKKLTATSKKQHEYIAVLEKDRERLDRETKAAAAEANRAAKDGQKHIDDLLAQLKELAATSEKQNEYIAILEKEQNRLSHLAERLAGEIESYGKVIGEQTDYIKMLEAQRAASKSPTRK